MGVECLDQLGEVSERAGQPIDLIDDDRVDPSCLHVDEQLLQGRPIHRPAGEAAVDTEFLHRLHIFRVFDLPYQSLGSVDEFTTDELFGIP
jgi:hypothetical protein